MTIQHFHRPIFLPVYPFHFFFFIIQFFKDLNKMAMLNSHLILHKETIKQHFEKYKTNKKYFIQIINLGAKNVGRNGLSQALQDGPIL